MGLTPFDVSNLNASIARIGNVAMAKQQQQEQQRRDMEAELLHRQMLANDTRRLDMAEEAQRLNQTGHVQAWLQGPEGGAMQFSGTQEGLSKLLDQSRAANKPLQLMQAPPTNKPQYGIFTTETPLGTMALHLNSEEEVDKVTELAKKLGGHPVTSRVTSRPAAAIQTVSEIQSHIDAADEARSNGDEDTAKWHEGLAELLKKHLQGNPPKGFTPTKSTTTNVIDPTTGRVIKSERTTEAVGGAAPVTGRLIRDPKTGKLVPAK